MIKNTLLAATLVAASMGAVQAATVTNGSFEMNGFIGPNFTTLGTGDTSMTGWTVASGSVDLISTYWAAQDGNYSIDMNGNGPGSLTGSIVDLIVGKAYELSFWMSGNTDDPDKNNSIKMVGVSVNGSGVLYTFDTTGKSHANLGWEKMKLRFIAEDTSAILTFGPGPSESGPYGAAIDNVTVAAVPLPAGAPLLLAALGGLGLLRRRRSV